MNRHRQAPASARASRAPRTLRAARMDPSPPLRVALLTEQLRLFGRRYGWQVLANLVVATACLLLFARSVGAWDKTLWWTGLAINGILRFFPVRLTRADCGLDVAARHRRLVAHLLIDGLLWALLILAVPYPRNSINPPFLVAIVTGLISGPIPFLSVLPGGYEAFAIAPVLALAWREYAGRGGSAFGVSMALAVVVLQAFATKIAHLNGTAVRERILRDFRLQGLLRRSRRREAAVHALLEASPDLIGLLDAEGRWQLANGAALEAFGIAREDLIHVEPQRLLEQVPDTPTRESLGDFMRTSEGTVREEILLRRAHATPRVLDLLRCALPGAVGGGSLLIARDVTAQKREALARQLRDRLTDASLRGESPDRSLGTVLDSIAEYLDLLWIAMARIDKVGTPLSVAQGGRLHLDAQSALTLALSPADPPYRIVYPLAHNGIHYGAIAYRPLVPEALSNEAKEWLARLSWDVGSACELDAAQTRLRTLAHYDELTGLPNRALFLRLLTETMERAAHVDALQAVLFLDLDRFKDINDLLGHAAGDRLLLEVTARLRQTARAGDVVARLSGDEFAVILRDAARMSDIETVITRLLTAMRTPIRIGTDQVSTQASIGLTIYPFDDSDPQTLLRHADLAMYEAKRQGRNRWSIFEHSLDRATRDRQSLQKRLRTALAEDRFALHYQPQVELATGRIAGMEALLRWRDPEEQPQSPEVFVAIAEESGLIIPLGEWVLQEACRQQRRWMDQGLTLQIAVNLSPSQFQDPEIHHRVCEVLRASGTATHHIALEITERAAFADPERARRTLDAWCQRGLQFAIDDFGTGQASLSYLTDLPTALIKIDRGFIAPLPEDPQHRAIVEGVIHMAHQLGRPVLAEGVETMAQWEWLKAQGCDLAQGYAIARPMPAEAVPDWLATWLQDRSLSHEQGIFVAAQRTAVLI
ncbi:putative bifunctional diguanylate cyclase/phosphodiesterase [Acidiferrobacter thiooxydans]|uniref:PAS domain S-box protein n=1 Tax=Acidiferrobacter thiooxydans TaxID=163359 RepID=A0A1C2FZW0_9GAMM|nr:EAL domain-containing protein [Acidiferrobacter thiooxydans]RCN55977.1 PAS domain S-box protein [Acidiferrobacter thiooxydans]UEN98753.1 EAL domain-containing protein [Acidiferrobacter thiooxydans]